MNPTSTNSSPTASPIQKTASSALPVRTRRVTDLPTRLYHSLLGLSFAGAYLSADSERLRMIHVTLGYTMAALLVFRVLYGLFGPRPLRWTSIASRLRGLEPWLRASATAAILKPAHWRQGQNLLMLIAVVGLLACVAPLVLSGHVIWNEWGGDWLIDAMEEVHEALGEGMLLLVGLHIGLLTWMVGARGGQSVMPMVSGRLAGPGPDLVSTQRTWLAVILGCAIGAGWLWAGWVTA